MDNIRMILWAALESEVGLEIQTSSIEAFKRKFYSERAKAREEGNYAFDPLSVVLPPPDITGKVWVVKNGQVRTEEQGKTGEEESPPVSG